MNTPHQNFAREHGQDPSKVILAKVQGARDMVEILPSLIEDLKELFDCEAVSLFALDRKNRQLFSRNPISDILSEIRVDISIKNLAGFVAATGKSLNIHDAYDEDELTQYHPQLAHGSTLDKLLDFKTRSILVLPLPYNRKLIGVLEIINKKDDGVFSDADMKLARDLSPVLGLTLMKLEKQAARQQAAPAQEPEPAQSDPQAGRSESAEERLHKLSQSIHAAKDVDEILIDLKEPLIEIFDVEMITLYAVDTHKNEIYSKMKSGDGIAEIRVPISPQSISGWVAMEQTMVSIADVYDDQELKKYHPDLTFDDSWDKQSGQRTRSMLVCPMVQNGQLMGVLQLINKKGDGVFTSRDIKFGNIISETLALAFSNQKKFVQQKPTKFSYILNNGIISEEELSTAITQARKNQVDIEAILLGNVGLSRKELGHSLENFYGIPYYGYHDSIILPSEVLAGLNKNFLAKNHWLPIHNDSEKVVILTNDPTNPDKLQNIKQIFTKKEIEFKVGLKADVIDFLNSITGDIDHGKVEEAAKPEEMSSLLTALMDETEKEVVDAHEDDDDANAISETDSTIVRLVNKVLIDAYERGVSDIHIEPGIGKEKVNVRFRKDGECMVYEEIPSLYKQAIISRIKIMSRLDIAERRMPQDGKIKMRYGRKEIEFRVATCPTVGGNEDAVLRILAQSKPIPLDQMNLSERNLERIREQSVKPYGLILVVGPTGSGKTTTLHSCLGHINQPNRKIWTAEDPVEITQKGLRQVQMLDKIGLNFARAMRSFLRGDPDVIMVGEMRDTETASIGLEASLTGHMVFSTLHTNSAPETITRLLDMGMNPLNFADALLLIVAQRLVKTLCKECKEDYHPSQEEFDTLVKEYGPEAFERLDIEYNDDLMIKKPVGCQACGDTGYAGRTALHEVLDASAEMKRLIMKSALVEELREQAMKDGMTTLKQDGIEKIFKGDCDLKSVLSVCIV